MNYNELFTFVITKKEANILVYALESYIENLSRKQEGITDKTELSSIDEQIIKSGLLIDVLNESFKRSE